MRPHFALICALSAALSGCSINDDLRQFRETAPNRISGAAWLDLVPLGAFSTLGPVETAPDARSIAARAAGLRAKAAELRSRPVLDPKRARQMRAALRLRADS